jgi:hypothetical protein
MTTITTLRTGKVFILLLLIVQSDYADLDRYGGQPIRLVPSPPFLKGFPLDLGLPNRRRNRPNEDALCVALVSPGMGPKRLIVNAVPGIQDESLSAHSDRQLAFEDEVEPFPGMNGRLVS